MEQQIISGLLERDRELATLDGALAAAASGSGRMVVLEGAAGVGKTALLDAAGERAAALGLALLRARGDELLAPVAWSVAFRLIAPALARQPAQERSKLLSGAAAPARELFAGGPAPAAPAGSPVDAVIAHALFWVISGLAESGPLLLAVDDAHWSDAQSLQFLANLANRTLELPVLLLVARRRAEPGAAGEGLLDRLSAQAGSLLLEVPPLSVEASAVLVRRTLGEQTSDELARACAEVTGGNPYYLGQLVAELAGEAVTAGSADAERVRTLTPASVTRAVLVRLARLGADALALCEAVSVLGDGCEFTTTAALAGLERTKAAAALDALATAEILRDAEPLGFVHPLVASSVYSEIPLGRRGELHLRAARLLADTGADPQLIAAQLLPAGRRGDEWVVDALRQAAGTTLRRGAASAAADYLERALEEPPEAGKRAQVLGELARAEAAAGRPQAAERFDTVLELVGDRAERARIHLELGQALAGQGRHPEALAAFERGLAEQGAELDDSGRELRAAYWIAKTMTAQASRGELLQLQQLVADELQDPTPGERALLATVAMGAGFGCHPCEQVTALAHRAWGHGALLTAETSDGLHWTLVTGALMFADELELELEICEQALADARRRGSRLAFATASFIRGGALAQMGRNDEAIAEHEAALAARQDGWSQYLGTAVGGLAAAQMERGDLAGARRVLQIAEEDPGLADSIEWPVVLVRRGELLLAEARPGEALEQLETAGRILTQAFDYVAWAPWRSGAVRALLALDRRQRAHELASELVELTRRLGAPSHLALALRTLAQTERGQRALELLEEAVSLFERRPERLQHAYALIEYGAALRRAGRRAAAGDLLRQGLGLAERGGLKALAAQAVAELAAAGARTRRHTLSGIEALTPTERRVVDLAAGDLSNREIAQQLFVTIKSVEYHLSNAYRKLGVRSRTGLAAALTRSEPAETSTEDRRRTPV